MRYYPKSFFKLILLGMVLVTLPLILALYGTAVSLERLTHQSQKAVYNAVQLTQDSRLLADRLTEMERVVRQYLILEDTALLSGYIKMHDDFQGSAHQLDTEALDPQQGHALKELIRRERTLFESVRGYPHKPISVKATIAEFAPMGELARSIHVLSNLLIGREVDNMRTTASEATNMLLWEVLALIPLAIFLAIGFTILITRPFSQINAAIRRMGNGQLSIPVTVVGPSDLVDLGRGLDWLRQRLLDLEQQKNKFLQHVSHELKTPLAALREGSELLADEVGGHLSAQQREITVIMQHKSVQLQKLIENLLNYSAVDAIKYSRATLHLERVDLNATIARVADEHKLALQARGVRLVVQGPAISLHADAERLGTIVDNLLSNAIKFSPPGGTIEFRVRRENDQVILDVQDEGPGIPPQDAFRVFDAFYQGKVPYDSHVKGTGLGLAIIKESVLAHNGNIEVVQDTLAGAHFRVRLPLRHVAHHATAVA